MKNLTAPFNEELVKMYHSKLVESESLKRENKELKQLIENLEKEITYIKNTLRKVL